MKRILCFGDSLTHGTIPAAMDAPQERYDDTVRWTGILQQSLTGQAVVIEEGLPSRTINLDDPRPGKDGRNGSTYLWPCIGSHVPLDVVIIWLGTNDTKDIFEKSPEQIAHSLKELVIVLQSKLAATAPDCRIIIMSPPDMDTANEDAKRWYSQAKQKLAALPELYKNIADELNVEYIDLYPILGLPKTIDGIHLSVVQNSIVANKVHEKLVEMGAIS